MIPNIKVMPRYFLVEISKKLMEEKRKLPGGLIVPDTDESGEHSLCYGTIVQIGKNAKGDEVANKHFPEARVGDTIILHHWVEQSHNFGDPEDEDFIYVAVSDNFHDIRGVEKADGKIIPHPSNLFCLALEKEKKVVEILNDVPGVGKIVLDNWKPNESGLYTFDGAAFVDDADLREKIEELEYHSKYMAQNQMNLDTMERMQGLQKEGEELTKELNKQVVHELELFAINKETQLEMSDIQPEDRVFALGWMENAGYDLNYKGKVYTIVKKDAVLMCLRKSYIKLKEPELV